LDDDPVAESGRGFLVGVAVGVAGAASAGAAGAPAAAGAAGGPSAAGGASVGGGGSGRSRECVMEAAAGCTTKQALPWGCGSSVPS